MVSSRESATSLDQMLAGRIAGVSVARVPGGGISVLIRGPTSFYLSNEPLFVVDGMPVEPGPRGTLDWLRPEDIASIAVLKDADAAIFGVRGGNGVVVIKTKGTH
jgi:iron complex outermembrane receptor protein